MSKHTYNDSHFDSIYLRLVPPGDEQSSRVIGVTTSVRGEGGTTVSIGLARSAVRSGASVALVIDASPRGERVADVLGVQGSAVETHDLEVGDLATQISHCESLGIDVLTLAASEAANSDSGSWEKTLEQLRGIYPLIVVDASDLNSPVPRRWQHRVDKLLLVIDTTRATVESLARLRKTIESSALKIFGFALNKRRFYVPNFIYRFIY